jgi:CRP-like cAMP-binding protein
VAQEDATVLEMPTPAFTAWIHRSPEFALALIQELSTRLREAEARIRSLQTERVERRIARLLVHLARKQGHPELQLSRQELADLTGTTLSTASRTLSAWDQQGLLEAGRERVKVLHPEALTSLAEAPEDGP